MPKQANKKKKKDEGVADHVFEKKELTPPKKKAKKGVPIRTGAKRKKTKSEAKDPFVSKGKAQNINKQLEEIYENSDGSLPDMQHFKKHSRSRVVRAFFFLLFSLLFLGAVATAGFFVIQPRTEFSERDVILTISGDDSYVVGQEVQYRIRYRNAQQVPLSNVRIQVRYPEGFVYEGSSKEPTNDKNDEWILGAIDAQGSGFLDIYGNMFGDIDAEQSFRVFMNYIPSNFSSEFQKVASVRTEATESPVTLSVEAPENVFVGSDAEFRIVVEPKEDVAVEGPIAVLVEPGVGFSKKTSQPESDEFESFQWSIDAFEKEPFTVSLVGAFTPDVEADTASVIVKVIGWDTEEKEGDGFTLSQEEVSVALVKTDVVTNLLINGSVGDVAVQPGESLNTSIVVKNNGIDALKQVRVRVMYDMPSADNVSILHWASLDDPEDGAILGEQLDEKLRRGQITWSAVQIPALQEIGANEQVTIDLSIPVRDAQQADLTEYTNAKGKVTVEVQYDAGGEQQVQSTSPATVTINSDLSLAVQHDTAPATDGGELHTVTWLLSNSFHELKDIEIEADIFGDITWLPDELVVPAGEAVFNEESNTLIWKIDSMPTSLDILALQFQVVLNEFNPSQTNLTSKVKVFAKDVFTDEGMFLLGDEVLLLE